MNKKIKTIAAMVLLLGVASMMGGCKKQPEVIITPTNLTIHKGDSRKVSVTFQNVTSYRFEIEDTSIAKLVTDPSSNSTLPFNGSADVTIKGCQVGNTNLLVLCTNEGIREVVPIEVLENE